MAGKYHVLNGDSLAKLFALSEIDGEAIICRECLIDGELTGGSLSQFWETRSQFIASAYKFPAATYLQNVVPEFEKIINLPEQSDVYLWFENDLFCQANMWFVLSLLFGNPKQHNIFRVFPVIAAMSDNWRGFGISTPEMLGQSYRHAVPFSGRDIELGKNLWDAYRTADFSGLRELSASESACFSYLKEVCTAHIERFPPEGTPGRPQKTVAGLLQTTKSFPELFSAFSEIEDIYGFGDLQVKNICENLTSKP